MIIPCPASIYIVYFSDFIVQIHFCKLISFTFFNQQGRLNFKMSKCYWSPDEVEGLLFVLTTQDCSDPKNIARTVALIHDHLKATARVSEEIKTHTQIHNKLNRLARGIKMSRDDFLRTFDQVQPKGTLPSSGNPEVIVKSKHAGGLSGSILSPDESLSRKGRNGNPDDRELAVRNLKRQRTMAAGLPNSTYSDREATPVKEAGSEPDSAIVARRDTCPISRTWDTKLAGYFRQLASDRGYDAPPSHDYIREKMDDIFESLERGIQRLTEAQSAAIPLVPSVLGGVDFRQLTHHVVPMAEGEVLSAYLRALCGHSPVARDLLPQAYAAAAIYQWVFCEVFKEDHDAVKGNFFEEALFSLAHGKHASYHVSELVPTNVPWADAPDVVRKLRRIRYMEHLEKHIKPKLPEMADSCFAKLLNVFSSIMMQIVPGLESHAYDSLTCEPSNIPQVFQTQLESDQCFRFAFVEAFNLKLAMAKGSHEYDFRFPEFRTPFDNEWMEPFRSETMALPKNGQVWMCLRPAILSVGPGSMTALPMTIVKAIVLLV